ncbi:MAG TPA: proline racemase family protein [Anaerolineales bacterium]|nr:proline racemase family protein [Anaerolineales bacterium]
MQSIPYLDSHTGGEPTRLIEQLPFDLGGGTVAEQLARLRAEHDDLRALAINEPRGSDVLVGACLVQPVDPGCQFGVIFFNNVGYLGMCGHGTIGVVASLAYRGRIGPGVIRLETPVGVVEATLHPAEGAGHPNRVSVRNVPAYRLHTRVAVEIDGRVVHGDVAWGGNWFFLCHDHGLTVAPENLEPLTDFAWRLREAYSASGLTGTAGAVIDHVELFGQTPNADSRSFVLCPGKAYDRSPCGTGTSAKLACLLDDGVIAAGQTWRQESVIGSVFEGRVEVVDGQVVPTITGEAWMMAEGTLLIDPRDPFKTGIR